MEPGSTIEDKAARAHALAQEVESGSLAVRRVWIHIAENLYAIKAEGLYELLGYDTFPAWIATPEIGLKKSQAYSLVAIYGELVIERNVPVEQLEDIEVSKIAEVMPSIREGRTDVAEALSDAACLSRSDLRQEYHPKAEDPAGKPVSLCECCGQVLK